MPSNYIFQKRNLLSTKRDFWKLDSKLRSTQTKGLKNTIFLFYHFWNFLKFSSQNHKKFSGKNFKKLQKNFPMQFQWKWNLNVYLIRIAFFAFLLPFFEAFGEIIDSFQLHILREELIIYKTRFLEAKLLVKK